MLLNIFLLLGSFLEKKTLTHTYTRTNQTTIRAKAAHKQKTKENKNENRKPEGAPFWTSIEQTPKKANKQKTRTKQHK
jgi:hypothetical protein